MRVNGRGRRSSDGIRQTVELREQLGDRIAVIDYDELCAYRARLLPALCRFASVSCDAHVLRHLHGKSVRKGVLARWETTVVDELAGAAVEVWSAAITEVGELAPQRIANELKERSHPTRLGAVRFDAKGVTPDGPSHLDLLPSELARWLSNDKQSYRYRGRSKMSRGSGRAWVVFAEGRSRPP